MQATHPDPLLLTNSWPLFDAARWMELRRVIALCGEEPASAEEADMPAEAPDAPPIGIWSCDLADNSLSWTGAVYDLFGIARDEPLTRSLATACYCPGSRRAMEQLRAHAIRHRRGFTLDAMIRRLDGETRWMRLSALPVLSDGKAVRLCGTKQDVTALYDGPAWRGF